MEIEKLTKMIMKLFSLKGRTNYSRLDVMAWVDVLKKYDEKEINHAFNIVIYETGFLDVAAVLKILEPEEPREAMALITWERLIEIARAGGHASKEDRMGLSFRILEVLGGMSKLRFCSNDFILSQMKKNYIELYCKQKDLKNYIEFKNEYLGKPIENLIGATNEYNRIENK